MSKGINDSKISIAKVTKNEKIITPINIKIDI